MNIFCAAALIAATASTQAFGAWPFDEAPYIIIGADAQIVARNGGLSTFCRDNGIDTAHLGAGQTLYNAGGTRIVAQYTHHSCIHSSDDRNGYDAVGVHIIHPLW